MASATDALMSARPRFVYITCGENGLYALRRLVQGDQRPVAVVTIPPSVAEKNQVSGYADVAPYCRTADIDLISLGSYQLLPADLAPISFDILVVNGWNRLIDQEVLDLAGLGGLGVHAGHPPIGHGRAPLVWNMLLGHSDIEVYVFTLTSAADNGNIVASRVVEITPFDDVSMLYEKTMHAAAELLSVSITALGRGDRGEPQEQESAIAYQARKPFDGLIDFHMSERQIYDFVRAQCHPYPGAFAYLADSKWTMQRVVPFDRFAFRQAPRRPGEILAALPSGLVVATGGSPVWVMRAEQGGLTVVPAPLADMEWLVGQRFVGKKQDSY